MLEFSAIKEEVTEERWEIHAKWSDWMIMDTIEISFSHLEGWWYEKSFQTSPIRFSQINNKYQKYLRCEWIAPNIWHTVLMVTEENKLGNIISYLSWTGVSVVKSRWCLFVCSVNTENRSVQIIFQFYFLLGFIKFYRKIASKTV